MEQSPYTRSSGSSAVVITVKGGHGLTTTDVVYCDFISGGATDGTYAVAVITDEQFSIGTTATTAISGFVLWGRTARGAALNTGVTYTRSTTTITVTSASHGLVANNRVYIEFEDPFGAGQSNGWFNVLASPAPTTNTFAVTGANAGATSGNINQLIRATASGATYSTTGPSFVTASISKAGHGQRMGAQVWLDFISATAPYSGYHLIVGVTDADTFDVARTDNSAFPSSSGGVYIATKAAFSDFVISLSTEASLDQTRNAQVAPYTITLDTSTPSLEELFIAQTAHYGIELLTSSPDLQVITTVQAAHYSITLETSAELGVEVPHEAHYSITLETNADIGPAPEDTNVALDPCVITLNFTVTHIPRQTVTYVRHVIDDAAGLCGYLTARDATDDVKQRLMDALNSALSAIYARAHQLGYFNLVTRTYTCVQGETQITLEPDVASLQGYVRYESGAPLAFLQHRHQVDRYAAIYENDSTPQAVYADRQQTTDAQGFTHRLLLAPPVSSGLDAPVTLKADVLLSPPRYSMADYELDTPVRMPHNYVQALLYPVVRKDISSSLSFVAKDSLQMIEEQYQAARVMLGAADITPLSASSETARASKEAV